MRWAAWLLLAGLCATVQAVEAGRLFRYRDARGVMHIGTNLPPGQAQAGYEVLDGRTLKTLNVVEPAPSAEQLVQLARRRRIAAMAEAATSKAEEAKRKEVAEQQNRDRMLLQTYASEAELTRLRDIKLENLALVLQATDNTIGHLRQNLAQMDATATEHKVAGRAAPATLVNSRVQTAADLASQEQAAAGIRQEQIAIRARFDADLDRYRRLTGSPAMTVP